MTDFLPYTPDEYEPEAPATALHFQRWFENWIAGFEGAAGAPRLMLAALPELVAGTINRANGPGGTTLSTTYVIAESCGFLQRGTVRLAFEHFSSANNRNSEAAVVRVRGGVPTTLQTWATSSLTPVARTLDVSVRPGDLVQFQHRTASPATSTMQTVRVRTSGGDLWPTFGGSMFVEGNTV